MIVMCLDYVLLPSVIGRKNEWNLNLHLCAVWVAWSTDFPNVAIAILLLEPPLPEANRFTALLVSGEIWHTGRHQ